MSWRHVLYCLLAWPVAPVYGIAFVAGNAADWVAGLCEVYAGWADEFCSR